MKRRISGGCQNNSFSSSLANSAAFPINSFVAQACCSTCIEEKYRSGASSANLGHAGAVFSILLPQKPKERGPIARILFNRNLRPVQITDPGDGMLPGKLG